MAENTASIFIRARNGTRQVFAEVSRDLSSLYQRVTTFAGSLRGLFTGGAIAGLFGAGLASAAIREAQEAERAYKSLTAVLRATGYAAGLTRADIVGLANELDKTTLFDSDEVLQAASVLATFRNVAGDTFRDALRAAADMSALFGGNLQQSVVQLGKALDNPVKGIGELAQKGVTFSKSQSDMIKQMVETNRLLDAQQALLAAVQGSLGGVAQEINSGTLGATRDLAKAWDDLLESFGNSRVIQGTLSGIVDAAKVTIDAIERANARLSQAGDQAFRRHAPERARTPGDVRRLDQAAENEIREAQGGPERERQRREEEARAEAAKKAREEAQKAADAARKQIDQLIEGYRREVQSLQGLTAEQRELQNITVGRYRAASEGQRQALLAAAREADVARQAKQDQEELKRLQDEYIAGIDDKIRALDDQRSRLLQLAEPLTEIREQLKALDEIQADPLRAFAPEVEEVIRLMLRLQEIDLQNEGPIEDLISSLDPLRAANAELNRTLQTIRAFREAGAISTPLAGELEVSARRRFAEQSKDQEVERIKDAVDPTRQLREELERLQELVDLGDITPDEYITRAGQLRDQIDDINRGLRDQNGLADELGFTFASAFEDAIVEGAKLRDLIRSLEQDIVRMVTRQVITKPIADLIGNLIGSVGGAIGGIFGNRGGGSGGGGGFFDTIFRTFASAWGAREDGGPVQAGQTVMAGEAGVELAIAGRAPRVLPGSIPDGQTVADVLGPNADPVLVGANGPEPVQFDRPVRIIPHAETVALLGRMAQEAAQVEKVVGRPDGVTSAGPLSYQLAADKLSMDRARAVIEGQQRLGADIPAAPVLPDAIGRRLFDVRTDVNGAPVDIPGLPEPIDATARRSLDVLTEVTAGMPDLPAAPVVPDWAVERVLRVDTKLREDDAAVDRMLREAFAGLSNGRELAEAVKHSVPHRRAGGLFGANQAMWVGEEGPELVAFGRAGRVIPHEEAVAMGDGRQTIYAPITIMTPNADSFRASRTTVARDISRGLSRAGR